MNPTLTFDEKTGKYILNVPDEVAKPASGSQSAKMAQERGYQVAWDESIGKYVIDITPTKPAEDEHLAKMEASGMAASIEKFGKMEVMGVPVGGVVLGTGLAFVIDKVIVDRLIASQTDASKAATYAMMADLVAAGVIAKFGPKYIGQSASKYCAFVLAYEAVSGKISEYLDKIWPKPSTTQSQLHQGYQQLAQPMQQINGGAWSEPNIMQQSGAMQNTGGNLGIYEGAF